MSRPDAIILAGGAGRRMGGSDKGLIELDGQTLISRVIAQLSPQVDRIIISANRHHDRYAGLGYPIIADELPGFSGPLAGIFSAQHATRSEWILVTPCDTPFLPANLVEKLSAAAHLNHVPLARARDPQHTHYAIMLLRRTLLDSLAAALMRGERSVQRWQAQWPCAEAHFEHAAEFTNLNTPDDLTRAHSQSV